MHGNDRQDDDLSPEEAAAIVASLEAEIREAILMYCPELEARVVAPFCVQCDEGEAWVVAREREAALFISLEFEQCGVGFLDEDGMLRESARYPDIIQAAQAFGWAVSNTATPATSH
jgi:hypothetical protein